MISKINSVCINGLEWTKIDVEVDIIWWMPHFAIVWLPDTAIQESKERVRSAVKNSWYYFPSTKVIVNLAPADIKKRWPSFDLAIAIWIIWKDIYLDKDLLDKSIFLWELALDWKLRSINWILPAVIFAKENNFEFVFVPEENKYEAALISGIKIIPIWKLSSIIDILTKRSIPIIMPNIDLSNFIKNKKVDDIFDFSFIIWQQQVKRALLIAASWWHNLLMEWPPWSWKTMLAKAFSTILPDMELSEIVEVSKIYSIVWLLTKENPLVFHRPFRKIHHTASIVSIIWWWKDSRPWEISLAHKWVLFLDEFLEFDWRLIETLRQPMEDWEIIINRINASYKYPAKFTFIWALNPCPCWFLWDKEKQCVCNPMQIERYRSKLSWPILDRIDIFINVPRIKVEDFDKNNTTQITSNQLKIQVEEARKIQLKRFKETKKTYNSEMTNKDIEIFCNLEKEEEKFLINAMQRLDLSTRVYFRTLKLARTIADLEGSNLIKLNHLAEALSYRRI